MEDVTTDTAFYTNREVCQWKHFPALENMFDNLTYAADKGTLVALQ